MKIQIDFEVYENVCPHCEMHFAVIGILNESWMPQMVEICPYCGLRLSVGADAEQQQVLGDAAPLMDGQ